MAKAPIAHGIEYATRGNPKDAPLLLVAGLGGGILSWAPTLYGINLLRRRKLYVIAYDPRGLNKSGDVPDYTLDEMVADAVGLLDYLKIAKAHVVGWSLGGIVAQALAYEHPERVDRLVLLATTPISRTDPKVAPVMAEIAAKVPMPEKPGAEDFKTLIRTVMKRSFRNPVLVAIMSRATIVTPLLDKTFYEGLAQQWQVIMKAETYGRLGEIQAPTLVAYGEADQLIPPEAQTLIYEALTCERAKAVIKKGSHACGIENMAQVNSLIRAWLVKKGKATQ